MANEIRIQAAARAANGSGEARRVRRAGQIPAALTRLSRTTETLQLDAHDFMMATRGQSSDQVLVVLEVAGQPVNALLREIQRDVISGHPIHVDFGEVDMSRKMRATVTIRLAGEAEGVRTEGGVLTQMTREVQIECLPADFVESFTVDISAMKIGDSLTAADLRLGDRYTLITRGDMPIAAVVEPTAEEVVAETPAEGAEAPAEGEEGKAAAPAAEGAAEKGTEKGAAEKGAAAKGAEKKGAAAKK